MRKEEKEKERAAQARRAGLRRTLRMSRWLAAAVLIAAAGWWLFQRATAFRPLCSHSCSAAAGCSPNQGCSGASGASPYSLSARFSPRYSSFAMMP